MLINFLTSKSHDVYCFDDNNRKIVTLFFAPCFARKFQRVNLDDMQFDFILHFGFVHGYPLLDLNCMCNIAVRAKKQTFFLHFVLYLQNECIVGGFLFAYIRFGCRISSVWNTKKNLKLHFYDTRWNLGMGWLVEYDFLFSANYHQERQRKNRIVSLIEKDTIEKETETEEEWVIRITNANERMLSSICVYAVHGLASWHP